MKRLGALLCAMMMAVVLMAPASFAVNDKSGDVSNKTGFTLEESSPENGATGVAVDNLSVKLKFSKDMQPKNKAARKANEKQFKLKDSEGNKIPVKVYYSDETEGLLLVAADSYSKKNKDAKIKSDEKYILTIGRNLKASDGTTLGEQQSLEMTTLNQSRSTVIYMVLMALMMVGMVVFVVRGTKKEEKKKAEEKALKEGKNPYKEAKKSGKSVEEIVAKNQKKKAKKEEAIRRQKEAEAAIEAEIIEKIRKESNKRVSAPKSIKATGSKLRMKVVSDSGAKVEAKESQAKTNKGTTRPKNQSGKKKNKGKKK